MTGLVWQDLMLSVPAPRNQPPGLKFRPKLIDIISFLCHYYLKQTAIYIQNIMKLTEKQKAFLGYISLYIEEWGRSPSFEEICSHFGFKSYNTVTTYLKALERKGYVRLPKEKNRKRAIEVISPVETRRFEFPLLGKVAAGKPIEAIEDVDAIEVPPSMIGSGDYFVLQVEGDSMKEDGILDGDFVVVRKQPTAEKGETVVVLINNEATIKKYHKRKNCVELHPANEGMEPIIVKKGEFRIEGKVVGLLRQYR
jgi:repressor LexA